ncbi:hypothetical protein [Flavobacterium sp.]|uniref:hypothetical protein n=1 Tax=Flavobacterium sp. TaxID=239 RepID=UPI0028BE286C|nr:hypothetical protein [Flavobacterium sp.]
MKSALIKKIMFGAVLLNSVVMFSQEEPPTPPPPTPPPGLPIDSGIALLVVGAIALAFYYKSITTKKASN